MYKKIKLSLLLVTVCAVVIIGYPLTTEGASPGFADSHPRQTARCFVIGDTLGFLTCLSNAQPRLDGVNLIKTVGHRIDLVAYPFGYLFILGLGLFIVLGCFLV